MTAPENTWPPRPSGLHLAVGLSLTTGDGQTVALRHGRGILFARGPRAGAHGLREPRGLSGASACPTPDGSFAVGALRVDPASSRVDALVLTRYRPGIGFDSCELDGVQYGISPHARNPAVEAALSGFRIRWTEHGRRRQLFVDSGLRPGFPQDLSLAIDAENPVRSVEISDPVARDLLDRLGEVHMAPDMERARRFPFIEGRADPTITRWGDRWLFIATDEHFAERRESSGLLLRVADTIDELAHADDHRILSLDVTLQGCFWAPELHVIGDRLWCLFAPSVGSTEWDAVQAWAMSLPAGADPADPASWSDAAPVLAASGGPLQLDDGHPGISLDMTYFEVRGRSYLAWSQRFTSPVIGDAEIWIAETTKEDPTRLISEAVRIVVPEYSWEVDETNVVEGPFALVREGTVFLTYSAAAVGPSYAVGLVTAAEDAELLDPASWTKLPYPVLDADPELGEWGPGHSMFVRDETGADLLIYHALPSHDGRVRHTGLRPVVFGAGGRLVLDAGTPSLS
ncbi:family 43 glycosylhydrolase [Agromyces albus]|uniref:Uncharacterized protein n=1 Tax=Agromyces albus TaxID=205332 RepID=A0A4Q2KZ23_9MICO|nr:family 43 glycosylhydrolase [Agromyces albus]RXZ70277.1 hypothetical protein ESP51_10315 [Agromyces albus]